MTARFVAALLLLAWAPLAAAHEFWIRVDREPAVVGEPVGAGLFVGTGWPGEAFARASRRIVRFALVDAAGERPLDGIDGALPAGRAVARAPGAAWLLYRSNPAEVELDAATFDSYLREEGLDAAIAQRARSGSSSGSGTGARPVRERYSRCAKALVTVAPGGGAADSAAPSSAEPGGIDWREPVGLTLELLPESDPRRAGRDGRLALRLLLDGRPLAGALVKAMREAEPGRWIGGRTDADGRVRLELPTGAGMWLVSTVHIRALPARTGFDWESTWSSLTFVAVP